MEEKGLQVNIEDVTGSMAEDLARISTDKAFAVSQVKALQKENDRLRDVIKELTLEKEGE